MVFGTHTDIACRLQRHTMTSVTIPTSTGPLHGGYPSVLEELSSSEPEFESSRNSKRSLCLPQTPSDSCKKRRKQSTPIRIYNSEPEIKDDGVSSALASTNVKVTECYDDEKHKCNVCQLKLGSDSQLQSHVACEHQQLEIKKDPDDETAANPPSAVFVDAPLCLTIGRPEMQWGTELPNKDWANTNIPNVYNSSNPVFMAMSQFNQPDNIQMKPARIFNPDAYCEMCNKEFCNKYFLKTHKANKHGIYTDTTSSEPQLPSGTNVSSYGTSLNLKLPTSVPSVDNLIRNDTKTPTNVINPYNIPFSSSFSNKLSKVTRPVLQNNELNNIQCSVSLRTCNGPSSNESDKYISEDQVDECSTSTNLPTESTSAKNESDRNATFDESIKMSPSQSSRELDLSNRLRRIGVMNPKAFCEICNKEYCNKYFLRTHKMKRHGIYIPDDRDPKIDGSINSPWPSTVQTSPLNLIVTESSSTVFDRKTTSPNDISCELCGIKFQNTNLAQLHNYTVHGKITKDDDNSEINFEPAGEDSKQGHQISKISNNEKSNSTENISEDLQKLQTMILQLNDLDMTKSSNICNYCNREFENRFYLHAHMVTDHGMLMEENSDIEKNGESENSNNNTLCDICGKDLPNAEDMKKHIIETHSNIHSSAIESSKDEYSNENTTSDKMSSNRIFMSGGNAPERRLSVNVTPTSSYCEICNKELCNKYFMKTHMQRMHGIEIENGAQIGGVVCDICNKELCSKYFLRVHKHNTHGIVEYGASLLQSSRKSESEPSSQPSVLTPESESALKPSDLADLSHRYFTHFTEVCPICSRRFRSTKWLKAHLVSDHGQAGVEKWAELDQQLQQTLQQHSKSKPIKTERASPGLKIPNGNQDSSSRNFAINNVLSSVFGPEDAAVKSYQCSYCPFTSPLLPLLFIHERIHTINENVPLKCPVCPQSFLERELFQRHIYSHHPFFPSPPVFEEQTDINKKTQPQESLEEEANSSQDVKIEMSNEHNKAFEESSSKSPPRISVANLPMEISQSLKDLAKKVQLPALYALPHKVNDLPQDESTSDSPGYVMQPFLLEDSASDRTIVPSVVFLPVLQKQPAPLTVTFTLTPA
ncbi:zinc finger protein 521 [Anthonomus grandis grandis]|uniref:zinc finger protein 521 n=1 Tax=Anthonomus grandis grandis TaxID=2921223 RepID=UPI00216658E8|nr:zinc finger protein 521 [Anthonomus grandis grandis]